MSQRETVAYLVGSHMFTTLAVFAMIGSITSAYWLVRGLVWFLDRVSVNF